MARRKKVLNIDEVNVVPSCKIVALNLETEKTDVLAQTLYTPRHINEALKKAKRTGWTWVVGPAGKELWRPGDGIAVCDRQRH